MPGTTFKESTTENWSDSDDLLVRAFPQYGGRALAPNTPFESTPKDGVAHAER